MVCVFYIISTFLGFMFEPCYVENRVITNCVIKRLICIFKNNHPNKDLLWKESVPSENSETVE